MAIVWRVLMRSMVVASLLAAFGVLAESYEAFVWHEYLVPVITSSIICWLYYRIHIQAYENRYLARHVAKWGDEKRERMATLMTVLLGELDMIRAEEVSPDHAHRNKALACARQLRDLFHSLALEPIGDEAMPPVGAMERPKR